MSRLSFIPLGVGDAFSQRWYSSCLAVESGGAWLLVDCPHPIRKMLHEARGAAGQPLDVGDLSAVVLTHVHADHCSGLEGLGYFSFFALGRRVKLVAHADVVARLWDGHLAAGMEQLTDGADPAGPRRRMRFEDYFEWLPLAEDRPAVVGPFTLECRPTQHHVPTTALRVHAAGASLGISADTSFDPGLIAWLLQADLAVHETNLGTHTPYDKLAALPPEQRARLRLIHYPDGFDLDGSCIEPLRERQRVTVAP